MTPSNHSQREMCRSCGDDVLLLRDFGSVPLTNRLLENATDSEARHRMRLGSCKRCRLLQLIDPVEAERLKPAKRLRYTEPEIHLDSVAQLIESLPGVNTESLMTGVSTKDQSTLDRLTRHGFRQVSCLDSRNDLSIEDPSAGMETIQAKISSGALDSRKHGNRYQVVVVRHLLEHAHDLGGFLTSISNIVSTGGYLVIEVPDFTNCLLHGDYSTLWEDHVLYFTDVTLPWTLQRLGLSVHEVKRYPYVPEDSLLVIAQKGSSEGSLDDVDRSLAIAQQKLGETYASQMETIQNRWREVLRDARANGKGIALLGAGHLGIMFLNLMELAGEIDLVLDDDPEKIGRHVPGTHHRIQDVSTLEQSAIGLCMLSVSPEGEERVLARNPAFQERGGRFASIFPGSPIALLPAGWFSRSR